MVGVLIFDVEVCYQKSMQLDLEDVLSSVFGRIVLFAIYLLGAIWVGSMIGGLAWGVGHHGIAFLPSLSEWFLSPLLLINIWIVPNAAFLAIMGVYLMVSDDFSPAAWGIIVAVESLFVMLGWCLSFHDLKDAIVAWFLWVVLLTMAETGIWLIRAAKRNRWAREMMELNAENAMHRAEREARLHGGDAPEDDDLKQARCDD